MQILMLDNYDSFTYNLVQMVREQGHRVTVRRNDALTLDEVADFDAVILSPGPGVPSEAGLLCPMIARYVAEKPMLGVCLGMQAIVEVFGGRLVNLDEPLHGVATPIRHAGTDLYRGVPTEFEVGRYHSWAAASEALPAELVVTATDLDGVIMSVEHRELPVAGVQYHPESILTQHGNTLIMNFLNSIA